MIYLYILLLFRRRFIPFSLKKGEKHALIEKWVELMLLMMSYLLPIVTDSHQTLLLKTASAAKNRLIKLNKNMSSTKMNVYGHYLCLRNCKANMYL